MSENRCTSCEIAHAVGLSYRVCKKTGNKKTCKKIFDKVIKIDEPTVKDAKRVVKQVKKITKDKKLINALKEVEKYLSN